MFVNRRLLKDTRGELDRALADYDQAIQLQSPTATIYTATIYMNRGLVKLLQGRAAEAQEDFAQCLALDQKLKPSRGQRIEQAKQLLALKP